MALSDGKASPHYMLISNRNSFLNVSSVKDMQLRTAKLNFLCQTEQGRSRCLVEWCPVALSSQVLLWTGEQWPEMKTSDIYAEDSRDTYCKNRQRWLVVMDAPQTNDEKEYVRKEVGQWQPRGNQNTAKRRQYASQHSLRQHVNMV